VSVSPTITVQSRHPRRGLARVLSRDPILLSLLAVGVLQSAYYISDFGGPDARIMALWIVTIPLDLAFAWLTWRVAEMQDPHSPARRFWVTLFGAALTVSVGDLYQAVIVVRDPRPELVAGSPVQSAFFAVALFAVTVVMLTFPVHSQTPRERMRFWLDLLTVLVGGAVLTAVFAIDPAAAPMDLASVLAGAAVTMVVLFAAVRLVLTGAAPVSQMAAALMVAAMFMQILAVCVTPTGPGMQLSAGVFLLRSWPAVLVAAGPRVQELQMANRTSPVDRQQRPYSALPYVAIAATFIALITILPGGVNGQLWGVVAGAVTITGLVVTRQLLAFHDNVNLINRLDLALLDLREHEGRLRHTAAHDRLTMLFNRDAFGDRVTEALSRGDAALLMIDLDDFKTINDTLGHTIGDGLLLAVARRLTSAVCPADIVARIGGDEFAVLLADAGGSRVDVLAQRILDSLASPLSVDGQRLLVRASIGGAIAGSGDDLAALLRNADIALYEAKDRGKSGYVRYAADMKARLFETAELGARLREGIEGCEFKLVYQPIVQFHDGRVVGVEALVRWHRRDHEIIMPDAFIVAAERTGLIVPLGRWILREACRQAGEWWREYGDAAPRTVSVNVSGRQLREPDFVDDVAAALDDAGLPPERLNIEMIETAVLDGSEINETLHKLRGLGVRLALDDFGTAASSLGLLLTVPLTSLKLDRSFVEGIVTVTRQAAVATAVAQIARALSLDLVAEGIETPEQAELLQRIGYRHAQGFMYHRPLPPHQVALLWQPAIPAPAPAPVPAPRSISAPAPARTP
jgi:diguanylate cyclase (GGDEF)-like protein